MNIKILFKFGKFFDCFKPSYLFLIHRHEQKFSKHVSTTTTLLPKPSWVSFLSVLRGLLANICCWKLQYLCAMGRMQNFSIRFWKWLFEGTVPSNKKYMTVQYLQNKKLHDGTSKIVREAGGGELFPICWPSRLVSVEKKPSKFLLKAKFASDCPCEWVAC